MAAFTPVHTSACSEKHQMVTNSSDHISFDWHEIWTVAISSGKIMVSSIKQMCVSILIKFHVAIGILYFCDGLPFFLLLFY